MALTGTLTLSDSYGRSTQRSFEMVDTILADAQTDLTALRAALTAFSDCGYDAEILTEKAELAVAAQAETNLDTGVTVRVKFDNGSKGSLKIPAPKTAKIRGDGTIDPADAELVAFFNLLGLDEPTTPAVATVYNGRKVSQILSAKLDK